VNGVTLPSRRRRKKPASRAKQRGAPPPVREDLRAASRAQVGRDEEARPPRPRDDDASIEDPLGDWPAEEGG
jgi:hypothetical protein